MELIFERSDGVMYAAVSGRLDGETAESFRDEVLGGVSDGDQVVVVDMSSVGYVSSAGLQTFLVLARSLRGQNVNFGICSLTSAVNEIFNIGGFRRALAIFDDRAGAAGTLRP